MKLRYSDFAPSIDIDALEEALGFEPIDHPIPDEDRGYCPLPWNSHSNGDTTGKFSINRKKRVYGCWVCGGGSLLDLAMAIRGEDLEPTIKWLYQFANRGETDEEFLSELDELLADPETRQPTMPYFNSHVLNRFSDPVEYAMEWDGEEWVPFIQRRGLDLDKLKDIGLGVCYNAHSARPLKEVEYVGPAICFPHFWVGKLVGWQQRWLDREEDRPRHVPKYTMTPDFPKDTLYAFGNAMSNLEWGQSVTVVESIPSCLFLWSHGYPAIATFGSSVSEKQLKLLRTFPSIYIAPDNDAAGFKWQQKITDYLERYIDLKILPHASTEKGADVGDLAKHPRLLQDLYSCASETWEVEL